LVRGHIHHGSRLILLEHSGKSGFASALCDGYRWMLERDVEAVVQLDADFSPDLGDLPSLLEALETIREVPVIFSERRKGKSKLSWRIVLEAVMGIPQLRK
jgi:hypothetical protein